MPTYTVKAGDSLSKIAQAHGISDWRAIYNDPANASFRSARPNPNLIQPGDKIQIPGSSPASPATGSTPAQGSGAPASNPSTSNPPQMGPASPSDDWIIVATDGTCSEEAYNTTYRRDSDNVAHVNSSDQFKEISGPVYVNQSYCKKFLADAYVSGGNKEFIAGGNTAGFWVMDKVNEATSFISTRVTANTTARIALVGHSRGGMVAVLVAKWLQQQSLEVDFLGLYDAVDRAPNTSAAIRNAAVGSAGGGWFAAIGAAFGLASSDGMDASIIPSNVKSCRHALRSQTVGSRWWFGNTATEWENGDGTGWKREFRASHGAIGGAVPHSLAGKSFFEGNVADDSGWEGQDLTESENSQGGANADNWIREGARKAGVPV